MNTHWCNIQKEFKGKAYRKMCCSTMKAWIGKLWSINVANSSDEMVLLWSPCWHHTFQNPGSATGTSMKYFTILRYKITASLIGCNSQNSIRGQIKEGSNILVCTCVDSIHTETVFWRANKWCELKGGLEWSLPLCSEVDDKFGWMGVLSNNLKY